MSWRTSRTYERSCSDKGTEIVRVYQTFSERFTKQTKCVIACHVATRQDVSFSWLCFRKFLPTFCKLFPKMFDTARMISVPLSEWCRINSPFLVDWRFLCKWFLARFLTNFRLRCTKSPKRHKKDSQVGKWTLTSHNPYITFMFAINLGYLSWNSMIN